jgi:hypothetical protein
MQLPPWHQRLRPPSCHSQVYNIIYYYYICFRSLRLLHPCLFFCFVYVIYLLQVGGCCLYLSLSLLSIFSLCFVCVSLFCVSYFTRWMKNSNQGLYVYYYQPRLILYNLFPIFGLLLLSLSLSFFVVYLLSVLCLCVPVVSVLSCVSYFTRWMKHSNQGLYALFIVCVVYVMLLMLCFSGVWLEHSYYRMKHCYEGMKHILSVFASSSSSFFYLKFCTLGVQEHCDGIIDNYYHYY